CPKLASHVRSGAACPRNDADASPTARAAWRPGVGGTGSSLRAAALWSNTSTLMLSSRRPPFAVVLALVAAVACALFPGAAFAAVGFPAIAEALELDPATESAFSWEPVSSTCAADEPAPLPPEPMCEIVAVDPDE